MSIMGLRTTGVICLVCACLACMSCIRDRMPEGADLGAGDRMPVFSVTMDDGSVLGTDDLKGRVSVIVFFHTGCPDCRQELPVIQRLYEEYGTDAIFCCISREEGEEGIREYWEAHSLTLPYSAQTGREVYSLFATTGVPRIYISSGDLVIYSVYDDSPLASYEELSSDIDRLLLQ